MVKMPELFVVREGAVDVLSAFTTLSNAQNYIAHADPAARRKLYTWRYVDVYETNSPTELRLGDTIVFASSDGRIYFRRRPRAGDE